LQNHCFPETPKLAVKVMLAPGSVEGIQFPCLSVW
jgi:hypothetical protein